MSEIPVAAENVGSPVADVPAVVEPTAPAAAPAAAPVAEASGTVLSDDAPKPEAPAAEAPAAAVAEPAAAEPETPAAPEPVSYEAFTAPEGGALDAEIVKNASELFGADRLSQERAQTYVDFVNNTVLPRWTEQKLAQDNATFTATLNDWRAEFDKSELGGNRRDTSLSEARTLIRHFGGTDEQRATLYALGAGGGLFNHPAIIRPLAGAGRFIAEVMAATGAETPAQALAKLSEPRSPPPALAPGSGRASASAADQRYSRRS